MARGISLANKCQLLFGAAVVIIVAAALIVPWFRVQNIIDEAQFENSRLIAELWADSPMLDPAVTRVFTPGEDASSPDRDLSIRWWPIERWGRERFSGGFLESAHKALGRREDGGPERDEHAEALWDGGKRVYRFARRILDPAGQVQGVVVVDRRSSAAANQLLVNRSYLLVAGVGAGGVAVLTFYLITTRIILKPVRVLKETAELVREGNLHIRSELKTGDEFEQLSDAFNSMLTDLSEQQQLLRGINKSLDLRLNELAERNTALYEAARLKGEFLANISHELRTPLNSIIGFAEILQDIAEGESRTDAGRGGDGAMISKRRRYLENIVNAGRTLLEMINELLAMAKIEAGSIELHVQRVNVAETCAALIALIKPLADRKEQRLLLQLQSSRSGGFTSDPSLSDLPTIESDQQKFQQILFNFLSNAVKFTPDRGEITVRAERLTGAEGRPRVRVSVLDTGPGIPTDRHAYIFEKFSQLDSGHTKQHQGTGLGLAIAREYAELLQGEIQLVSDSGRGSMFSLIVPLEVDPSLTEGTRARLVERAAMAQRPVA